MNKRGTLAILFLGLGFLVFVGLVFAGKIAPKDNYVGKTAIELYLGSEQLHHILYLHRIAGTLALDEALIQHTITGREPCLVETVRLWDHDRCRFTSKTLLSSYLTFFDLSFSHHLQTLLLSLNITFPSYTYRFTDDILHVQSSQPLTYHMLGFQYTMPISLELRHDTLGSYLQRYQRIYETVTLRAPCLLQQQDLNSCFSQKDFTIHVEQRDDYLFFTAQELSSLRNIEIRFAIPLNSLDELSSTEHISF
ncbi:MAG: hypothetical protein AABX72_03580 [Nanoarchaeota archaeon]